MYKKMRVWGENLVINVYLQLTFIILKIARVYGMIFCFISLYFKLLYPQRIYQGWI